MIRPGTDRRDAAGAARAFTIVEMLVVVGIVVFLTGLAVTIGGAAAQRAHRIETESTLTLLDQAMEEWEVRADRSLTWRNAEDEGSWEQFDVHGDTTLEPLIITEMLEVISRTDAVRQMLARIRPEFVYTYEAGAYPPWIHDYAEAQADEFAGGLTVLDGWGQPIYATHPGRPWSQADGPEIVRDADGTIQTKNEGRYGVARHLRVCFVSAGPDGEFGFMNPALEQQYEQTADNLFSYAVDRPEPILPQPDLGGG